MADDPWASGIVPSSTQAGGPSTPDPWASGVTAPAPEIQPNPDAFKARMAQGHALDAAFSDMFVAGGEEGGQGMPSAPGAGTAQAEQIKNFAIGVTKVTPFRQFISGFPAAHDAYAGKIGTMDAMIERAGDMMSFALVSTAFRPIIPPLIETGNGVVSKIVRGESGEPVAQAIGEFPPKVVDFATAAENISRIEPITAYHGSPYSFDAFSSEHIGAGEGAQSYGHGLYFAENPEVAKTYAPPPEGEIGDLGDDIPENYGPGQHYQVRIHANKEDFLDWDKPLAEQSEKVRDAFAKQGITPGITEYGGVKLPKPVGTGMDAYHLYSAATLNEGMSAASEASQYLHNEGVPGIKYLDQGSRFLGGKVEPYKFGSTEGFQIVDGKGRQFDGVFKTQEEAQAALDKYKANPTRNLVVFNAKNVEITHRNGEAVQPQSPTDLIKQNLIDRWHDEGLHPAELAEDAEHDAFLRHDLSSAAAQPSDIPPLVSPDVQPLAPAGKIATLARNAVEKANDLSRDVKMLVSPMTAGTKDTMAIVKDFANAKRRNAWEWARSDQDLVDKFTPAEREEMWNKADEESVLQQEGEFNENMGAATMRPDMEAKVDELQQPSRIALGKAQELGIIKGEGLPYYTPRMVVDMLENFNSGKPMALGAKSGVRTSTPGAFARKHLTAEETEAAAKGAVAPGAQIFRDIRTLPLATYRLEEANAGRALINQIKEYGAATGKPTVVNGELPAGADPKDWFTVEHPSFRTWEPMYERDAEGRPILEGNALKIAKNENGDMLYQSVPLHVSRDFEGPLKSVFTEKNSKVYNGMMALKGKTMSLVMNSPMIHNVVEWSRALPAMPGKVLTLRAYFEGNAAKNNPDVMREFLDNGLVPIGKRFFNQDISGILESPDLTPGRSWTAKIAAFVPGLFDEAAGTAVKQAIDKAGDFWHNTLLWDRVADLQMGLATNFQKDAIAAGMDRVTATRYAAHFANRFAGSLPQEAMSQGARKIANLALFSRTYTLGNLGVMKDMFTGMPQDVLAQIERDAGPEALAQVKSKARRMAISTVAFDVALTIIGGSILQNTFNVMANDSSLEQELHGYVRRMQGMMNDAKEHPLSLLLPWNLINEAKKISSQSDNEPGKQDRIHVGNMADGTGIYVTNPTGRMGNEFMDYMTGPLDQMRRKMGTYAKPALSILANQQYFGEAKSPPIYDANASDIQNGLNIGKTVLRAQAPAGQMDAFGRLVTGDKNTGFDALQLLGPLAGTSVSKGAPGGPIVGEYYHDKQMQEYQVQTQMKDIRDLIDKGKEDEARDRMTALGMPRLYQNWVVRTTENPAMRFNPRVTNQLYNALTPAQRERMERLRGY